MECKTVYHGDWAMTFNKIAQDKTPLDHTCDECMERYSDAIETQDN